MLGRISKKGKASNYGVPERRVKTKSTWQWGNSQQVPVLRPLKMNLPVLNRKYWWAVALSAAVLLQRN